MTAPKECSLMAPHQLERKYHVEYHKPCAVQHFYQLLGWSQRDALEFAEDKKLGGWNLDALDE